MILSVRKDLPDELTHIHKLGVYSYRRSWCYLYGCAGRLSLVLRFGFCLGHRFLAEHGW